MRCTQAETKSYVAHELSDRTYANKLIRPKLFREFEDFTHQDYTYLNTPRTSACHILWNHCIDKVESPKHVSTVLLCLHLKCKVSLTRTTRWVYVALFFYPSPNIATSPGLGFCEKMKLLESTPLAQIHPEAAEWPRLGPLQIVLAKVGGIIPWNKEISIPRLPFWGGVANIWPDHFVEGSCLGNSFQWKSHVRGLKGRTGACMKKKTQDT